MQIKSVVAVVLTFSLFFGLIAVTIILPPPGIASPPLPYRPLTSGLWNDISPAWSPDGKLIAFSTDRNGGWEIYIMKPDGSWYRQLTPTGIVAADPSWSPDSSSVAFWSLSGSRTALQLAFAVNSTILTITAGGYTVLETQPKWSPDGENLLFFIVSDTTELVSVNVDTKVLKVVAAVNGDYISADWISPTEVVYSSSSQGRYQILSADIGTGAAGMFLGGNADFAAPVVLTGTNRVAYISDLVPVNQYNLHYPCPYLPGDFNLWVINSSGSNPIFQSGPMGTTNVPFTPGQISPAQRVAWSPDGNIIAYVASNQVTGSSIYLWDVVNRRSTVNPVGPFNANSTGPSWSPDNINLVFAAEQGGLYHIFILNTTNLILLMPKGEQP